MDQKVTVFHCKWFSVVIELAQKVVNHLLTSELRFIKRLIN